MKPLVKKIAKIAAQHSIGHLPAPASRLIGKLGRDGGTPVRDIRLRPWVNYHSRNWFLWSTRMRPAFRQIFLTGVEGTPQPLAKQFAEQWAEYCGCRYGLLLPHGTDALRIALAAALKHDGLDYGGEVIVPNLSFIATANAALDRRFGLVFVDVDPQTLLIDPVRVEEAIVPGKTRAIMPVHLFGQPASMTALRDIAQRHKLKIVEDAAQAHGAVWETGPVGCLGDAAGFSFQSFKNLPCGEGGALTTNDEELFDRAYSLHNVGRTRVGGERWTHVTLGWNCRPTEYQAALLIERFRTFARQQDQRRGNFSRLREMLSDVSCVQPLAIHSGVREHGMHMFAMRYRPEHCAGIDLTEFLRAVQSEGAPIHRHFESTMSDQPAFQTLRDKHPEYFRLMATPVAEQAAKDTIYIPHNVFLGGESDMADIAAALRKVERHYVASRAGVQSTATREMKLVQS